MEVLLDNENRNSPLPLIKDWSPKTGGNSHEEGLEVGPNGACNIEEFIGEKRSYIAFASWVTSPHVVRIRIISRRRTRISALLSPTPTARKYVRAITRAFPRGLDSSRLLRDPLGRGSADWIRIGGKVYLSVDARYFRELFRLRCELERDGKSNDIGVQTRDGYTLLWNCQLAGWKSSFRELDSPVGV